jgi:predicted ATP-grasp superfamily ATP-dependent carboligase
MHETSKILVLGNYRQTLTVIRSLAKTGCSVVVGRDQERKFTEFSRYTSEVWIHPSIKKQEEEFINQLTVFLNERKDVQYIFPVDEDEVACLERHRDTRLSSVRIVMTDKKTFFTCIDKGKMYTMCASVGIPIPETKVICSLKDLQEGVETFGFPVLVKPNDGYKYFFDNKAIICHTQRELDRFFSVWPEGNEFIVLQKYIIGYRHNCHFFAVNGALRAYFEHKTIRTDRVNGTGLGVDNITVDPSPLREEYCSNLLRKLGYTGVGCVQFLVTNNNQAYFLEINPRLDANCAIPYRCGYDFPRFAYESVRSQNKETQRFSAAYSSGRRAHWFMGDVYGLDNEIKRGNVNKKQFILWILRTMKTLIVADFHITWWWRDPLPTLYLFYSSVAGVMRRLGRKIGDIFTRHS